MTPFMASVSQTWNVVAATAQAAAAVAMIVLAVGTILLASRTRELAQNAKDQVDSTLREAKATENLALEARTDRQLVWRPQLQIRGLGDAIGSGWYMTASNTGSGPAIDVVVAIRDIHNVGHWGVWRVGDLRPGDSQEGGSDDRLGMNVTSIFEGFIDCDLRRSVSVAIMCTDVLGRRMRFGIADPIAPYPGEASKALQVEMSILNEEHPQHVGWAQEPLIWG
jgi:hypothetical protein